MTSFVGHLQFVSMAMNEEKIYYIVYDDFRTPTTRIWHRCVS